MKMTRLIAAMLAIMTLLTLSVFAVEFVPSIERKECPELVEHDGDDLLIVTPLSDAIDETKDIHEDIENNLISAYEELGDKDWQDLVEGFAEKWDEFTGGAPITNAVISDIFDARFTSELGADLPEGKTVTFKVKIQGITTDDTFMIIYKEKGTDMWKVLEYTIDENNVITITATSMSAFAVVLDNEADPAGDHDDGPQTGVEKNFAPAIIAAVVFAVIAALCVGMIAKRKKA